MKRFLIFLLTLGMIVSAAPAVHASQLTLEDYLGDYMDISSEKMVPGGAANPTLMSLYIDENGVLTRYSRMAFGTTGTTFYYPYTKCIIDDRYIILVYEQRISPAYGTENVMGAHIFFYENGNLLEDDPEWQEYLWYCTDDGNTDTGDDADPGPLTDSTESRDGIHWYEVFNLTERTSWEAAEAYFESLGGHLATLTTKEENDYVYNLMLKSGFTSAYFGLRKDDDERFWITGEDVSYENWAAGEPSSYREPYAMFYYVYPDGTWNDGDARIAGDAERCFICEWESEEAYQSYQNGFR